MKTVYSLLSENRALVRRMLQWPVLWRLAVKAAFLTEHVEDPHCLNCAARLRKNQFTHIPIMNTSRVMVCSKCGRALGDWLNNRRCPGKPPARPSTEKKPDFVVFPLNWD